MNEHAGEIEILLVEDNPEDAELTLRALKKHNLTNQVEHVTDGEAALSFIFARDEYSGRNVLDQPRVVLLDLKLPKVDGLEVLRCIRENEQTKRIPVVVMTSSQEESDIIETYNLNVNSYIVKPLSFEQFLDTVATLGFYWVLINKGPKPV